SIPMEPATVESATVESATVKSTKSAAVEATAATVEATATTVETSGVGGIWLAERGSAQRSTCDCQSPYYPGPGSVFLEPFHRPLNLNEPHLGVCDRRTQLSNPSKVSINCPNQIRYLLH